ncbi:hypothetical protein pdam_00025010, partial [Pocillopora damicornis]
KQFKAFKSLEAYSRRVLGFISNVQGKVMGEKFVVIRKIQRELMKCVSVTHNSKKSVKNIDLTISESQVELIEQDTREQAKGNAFSSTELGTLSLSPVEDTSFDLNFWQQTTNR